MASRDNNPPTNLSPTDLLQKHADASASCLFSAMSELLKDSDTADFTLICGDQVWKLHSPVLAMRSPIFRAAIANNKANKLEMTMEIRDRDPEAMQEVINFMYGIDENITKENLLEIGKIAEFYDIEQLIQNLAVFIVRNGIEMKEEDLVPKLTVNVLHIFKDALKQSKEALKLKESLKMSKEMEKDLTKAQQMGKNCGCTTNSGYLRCIECRNLSSWARSLTLPDVSGTRSSQSHEDDDYPDFLPPNLSADSCLLTAMAQLLLDSDTADFTLICGEKEWKLHSPILAIRSDFFRAAILTNMVEKREMKMEIKELDPESMLQVIKFMYGHPIGEAPLVSLLEASERFQMADMKEEVIKIGSENVNEKNVLDIGKLAEFYDIEQLLQETAEFIVENDIEMKEKDMVPKLATRVVNVFKESLKQSKRKEKQLSDALYLENERKRACHFIASGVDWSYKSDFSPN